MNRFFSLCCAAVLSCCSLDREARVYRLPQGSEGWFIIFESVEGGNGETVTSKSRVFHFDANKICKIKDQFGNHWGSDIFLYPDGTIISSNLDELEEVKSVRERKNGAIEIGGKKVWYNTFFVGDRSELKKGLLQFNQFLEEKIDQLE
jgi:hypothetical protein